MCNKKLHGLMMDGGTMASHTDTIRDDSQHGFSIHSVDRQSSRSVVTDVVAARLMQTLLEAMAVF